MAAEKDPYIEKAYESLVHLSADERARLEYEAREKQIRVKDGKRYLFILNYDKEPQKVVLKEAVMDMDTKDEVQGSVLLKGYETKVYRIF